MRWWLSLIVVFCSLLVAPGQQPEPEKKDATANDLAKMQGKWQVIESENQGATYQSDGQGAVIVIDKNSWIDLDGDGKPCGQGSIKLAPSKSPRTMDLTVVLNRFFPDTKGKTSQGIYQLDGDRLKIAMTFAPYRGYPEGFTTRKGCHFLVTTYKRVKP